MAGGSDTGNVSTATSLIDEDCAQRATIHDTAIRPLEQQLNRAVADIIRTAEECRLHQIERAEAERQRQERERREREETSRRSELRQLADAFDAQAAQWSQCQQLRAFLAACKQALLTARGGDALPPDSSEGIWLRWARGRVQRLDPIDNGAVARAVQEVAGSAAVRYTLKLREPAS